MKFEDKYKINRENKIIIRQVELDRYMRLDSNLHKIIIDVLIDSIQQHKELETTFQNCPVSMETVKYVSQYLRVRYEDKEQKTFKQIFNKRVNEKQGRETN